MLFARKFDVDTDSAILDMIDQSAQKDYSSELL